MYQFVSASDAICILKDLDYSIKIKLINDKIKQLKRRQIVCFLKLALLALVSLSLAFLFLGIIPSTFTNFSEDLTNRWIVRQGFKGLIYDIAHSLAFSETMFFVFLILETVLFLFLYTHNRQFRNIADFLTNESACAFGSYREDIEHFYILLKIYEEYREPTYNEKVQLSMYH